MVGDFGYFQDFGFEWFQPNISVRGYASLHIVWQFLPCLNPLLLFFQGIYPTIVILAASHRNLLSEDIFTTPSLQLDVVTGSQPCIPTALPRPSDSHIVPDLEDGSDMRSSHGLDTPQKKVDVSTLELS